MKQAIIVLALMLSTALAFSQEITLDVTDVKTDQEATKIILAKDKMLLNSMKITCEDFEIAAGVSALRIEGNVTLEIRKSLILTPAIPVIEVSSATNNSKLIIIKPRKVETLRIKNLSPDKLQIVFAKLQ